VHQQFFTLRHQVCTASDPTSPRPDALLKSSVCVVQCWNAISDISISNNTLGESGKTLNCLLAGDSNGEGEGPDGGRSLRIHNLSETKDKIFSKSVIDQIKVVYHEVIANFRVACFYCWKQNGSRELYSFFESSMKYLSLLATVHSRKQQQEIAWLCTSCSKPIYSPYAVRLDDCETDGYPLYIDTSIVDIECASMIDHTVLVRLCRWHEPKVSHSSLHKVQ
jgi:hypothetical protein